MQFGQCSPEVVDVWMGLDGINRRNINGRLPYFLVRFFSFRFFFFSSCSIPSPAPRLEQTSTIPDFPFN